MILVYITCKNLAEAEKISKALLKKKLIACANIIPKVKSVYWWKGKIARDSESVLLCKSTASKFEKIKKQVRTLHSYELPCVEMIKAKASEEFEKWVKSVIE